ncbi:hypothetical protein [Prosthecobacter sp.]|uniref:hypothetical protein n=1 Tax=Prosthecobacter sp. TaxID=1965333 RepID=UPI0037836E2B
MERIHRMFAALLLLAYAGTATSIMPAVFAALAAIDGGHRVMICRTEQGMQVRLHHREDDFTPEVCDHEGLLGRILVSYCEPGTEGDHSLSTNQVTGTLTEPDDEAKRQIKERPCCEDGLVFFDARMDMVRLEEVCKEVLRGGEAGRNVALREMTTVRLLV